MATYVPGSQFDVVSPWGQFANHSKSSEITIFPLHNPYNENGIFRKSIRSPKFSIRKWRNISYYGLTEIVVKTCPNESESRDCLVI